MQWAMNLAFVNFTFTTNFTYPVDEDIFRKIGVWIHDFTVGVHHFGTV